MSKNIDKIIYINLNKRTDRRTHIENELNNYNLPFERFEAIETTGTIQKYYGNFNTGIIGCGMSHLNVLKIAKDRGYENILIFEDDFEFLISKEEFEEQLELFFNSNIDYNVCMLSYSNQKIEENFNSELLFKITFSQTASGYIVHKNYYDTLINLYEWALPLLESTGQTWIYSNDIVWKELQSKDNWFGFKKKIGKQMDGFSDTANCLQSRDC
jgi:glycosyl transferase family 25